MSHVKASISLRQKATLPDRANGQTCRQCPAWQRLQSWCPIVAAVRQGFVAACEYGRRKIRSAAVMASQKRASQNARKRPSVRSEEKTTKHTDGGLP